MSPAFLFFVRSVAKDLYSLCYFSRITRLRVLKMEKLDIHGIKERYCKALARFKKDKTVLAANKKLILEFLRDAELGKTIKNRAKKKIGESRLAKYLYRLRDLSNYFNKSFRAVTQKDMERFIYDLERDRVKGKKYKERTKVDIKNNIKKFWKWLYDGKKAKRDEYGNLNIVNWIDTSLKEEDIPALTREEVEILANACSTKYKAVAKVLFDSGARIEEFLNLTIGDLTKKEDFYKIRIRYSKTKPRTISIPMCIMELENWLRIHPDRKNLGAYLFPITYGAIRMELKRKGKKILGKNVTPHILRHSSATYYCNKLTPFQLCYRYGWSMSSRMPARYIDREGIIEEKTAEIIKGDEVNQLRKENKLLNEELQRLKEDYTELRAMVGNVNRFMIKLVKDPVVLRFLVRKIGQKKLGRELREM